MAVTPSRTSCSRRRDTHRSCRRRARRGRTGRVPPGRPFSPGPSRPPGRRSSSRRRIPLDRRSPRGPAHRTGGHLRVGGAGIAPARARLGGVAGALRGPAHGARRALRIGRAAVGSAVRRSPPDRRHPATRGRWFPTDASRPPGRPPPSRCTPPPCRRLPRRNGTPCRGTLRVGGTRGARPRCRPPPDRILPGTDDTRSPRRASCRRGRRCRSRRMPPRDHRLPGRSGRPFRSSPWRPRGTCRSSRCKRRRRRTLLRTTGRSRSAARSDTRRSSRAAGRSPRSGRSPRRVERAVAARAAEGTIERGARRLERQLISGDSGPEAVVVEDTLTVNGPPAGGSTRTPRPLRVGFP